MQAHFGHLVNPPLAPWPHIVLRLTEKIIQRRLRGLERARTAFDQTPEIRGDDHISHLERTGLVCSLPQILGVCTGQIDDALAVQSAGLFEWTDYDDFHEKR